MTKSDQGAHPDMKSKCVKLMERSACPRGAYGHLGTIDVHLTVVVEIFLSGPKLWTNRLIIHHFHFHSSLLHLMLPFFDHVHDQPKHVVRWWLIVCCIIMNSESDFLVVPNISLCAKVYKDLSLWIFQLGNKNQVTLMNLVKRDSIK